MIKRTFKKGMVIALTAVMMSTSVTGVFPGTAATVFAKESARKMEAFVKTKAKTEIPKADILDLVFDGGNVQDRLNGKRELKTYGEPTIAQDDQLGREVAVFDGKDDGYGYLLTPDDWKSLGNHYSFECMIKESTEDTQGKYGNPIIGHDKNRDGGFLAFKEGGPAFIGLKSQKYTKDLIYQYDKETWVHIAGTYDGASLRLYINGQKQKEVAATEFSTASRKADEYLNIAAGAAGIEKCAACKLASARVYSKALSAEEVKSLYNQEEKTDITVQADANFVIARGDTYKVPAAEVKTATGAAAEIKVTVKDPEGNEVTLDENQQFDATEQGEYKISYTANGTTLEKTLRVMGEPSVSEQMEFVSDDQRPIQIQNLDKEAKVQYTSVDPEVAAIDEQGVIQAKRAGETTIEITVDQAGHTYSLSSKIIVTEKPCIISEKVMTEGESFQLVVEHADAGTKTSYTSTAPDIATVDEKGEVQAKKTGIAEIQTVVEQKGNCYTFNTKITVEAKPETPATPEVPTTPETPTVPETPATPEVPTTPETPTAPEVPATPEAPEVPATPAKVLKPTINVKRKKVLANKKFKIKVGHRVTNSKVSFRTKNKKIATVSKFGYVKGVRAGKTTIVTTVRQGGKVFTFKTTVMVKGYVKIIKAKKKIKRNKSYKFRAKAYGTGKKVKWSVSNKKFAKISKKGKFTAKKKKGKVYVIVKSGKYTKKFCVRIK